MASLTSARAATATATLPSPLLSPHATPAESSTTANAATDLSLFLEPSFDACSYVSSLIRDVDASTSSAAQHPSTSSSSTSLLQPPTDPIGRKSSISLSPVTTSPISAKNDPGSRKREQVQEDIDLSLAISRLNLAIEELDRSISTQVTTNAPELLRRTSNLATMQSGVGQTRDGLKLLDDEVKNLRVKVHDPFVRLVKLQADLRSYDAAGDLVARTSKVVTLARRLESQMESLFTGKRDKLEAEPEAGADETPQSRGQVHGRDLSRAALLISELTTLLNTPQNDSSVEPSLLKLRIVQDLLPTLESARSTVVDSMEDMIVRGLRDLSPIMLGSALQTAFNLGILPRLVQDLLNDLTEVVKERTAAAFDLSTLSRQLNSPIPTLETSTPGYSAYRSGRRTNTTEMERAKQQQVWADALWKRLESLIVVEMGAVCSKVYLLEKVLKLKSDSETGVNFLSAALEVLGDKPSYTFWLTFAQSLQGQVMSATGRSGWLAQMLSGGIGAKGGGEGFPKLLRLFQEFFGKIGVYTDIQYSSVHQSPETVILLKSLGGLERDWVDRSTLRIGEVLSSVISRRTVASGEEEAEEVIRMIANVLDTSRFDPLLSRTIVIRCCALVDQFGAQMESVVGKDASVLNLASEEGVTHTKDSDDSLLRFAHTLSEGLKSISIDQELKPTTTTISANTAITSVTTSSTFATIQLQTTATRLISVISTS
ncbi:uncharacterized protein UTRI_04026 [Ustilago trichophora]|uniref:Conserved oligomeric Golgi complex subunit 5 n=1 Tax=Ustilago trichophora TaxID=86804 RepID=A0A5C3E9V9_9BASI|nr:uncharacterized protein UTRI_04026 [Ustilago trichophora]